VVIGGGFIGSEMAAALSMNNVDVTMIFPDPYLVNRVFPEYLGRAIQDQYRSRGIKILANEQPSVFSKNGNRFTTYTLSGKKVESDMVIVGIGIAPSLDLARNAGLQTANGIIVDEYLQASLPGIYAAGDNAFFPYQALGIQARIEHWDNALNQGKAAGRNMAGAREPFTYMPYFFSDLFEFGYEAVGDVDARLETVADWQKENDTGVIYYLRDGKIRGAMMCNVWEKVEAARTLIRKGETMTPEKLRGLIR
jgi:NADPH-dependent 2,4-dienoyl-CoA reductase/sulfur reductase-like enzyme